MPLKDTPDHHDAEVLIRLYDLRREPVLRASRAAIAAWRPAGPDDLLAVADRAHELNAAFRQVSTYWEMVYAFAKHGVLHTGLMLESSSEGLFVYAKVAPWIGAYRECVHPRALHNAEWLATATEAGRYVYAMYEARLRPR
jgi:hypothetical protein